MMIIFTIIIAIIIFVITFVIQEPRLWWWLSSGERQPLWSSERNDAFCSRCKGQHFRHGWGEKDGSSSSSVWSMVIIVIIVIVIIIVIIVIIVIITLTRWRCVNHMLSGDTSLTSLLMVDTSTSTGFFHFPVLWCMLILHNAINSIIFPFSVVQVSPEDPALPWGDRLHPQQHPQSESRHHHVPSACVSPSCHHVIWLSVINADHYQKHPQSKSLYQHVPDAIHVLYLIIPSSKTKVKFIMTNIWSLFKWCDYVINIIPIVIRVMIMINNLYSNNSPVRAWRC